ncbi:hypothetical protein CTI14_69095, partial [Methylobacterium radiotolerans]
DDLATLVLDELALTRRWVVRLTGGEGLLENKPVLQRAVQLRSRTSTTSPPWCSTSSPSRDAGSSVSPEARVCWRTSP